jgi:hypothetical protein
MELFHEAQVQQDLTDILFCYAKRYSPVAYRQVCLCTTTTTAAAATTTTTNHPTIFAHNNTYATITIFVIIVALM